MGPVPKIPKMPLVSVQNHQILSPRYQKCLCPPFKTTKSCPQGTKNAFGLRSKPPNPVPKVPKMPLASVQNHHHHLLHSPSLTALPISPTSPIDPNYPIDPIS